MDIYCRRLLHCDRLNRYGQKIREQENEKATSDEKNDELKESQTGRYT